MLGQNSDNQSEVERAFRFLLSLTSGHPSNSARQLGVVLFVAVGTLPRLRVGTLGGRPGGQKQRDRSPALGAVDWERDTFAGLGHPPSLAPFVLSVDSCLHRRVGNLLRRHFRVHEHNDAFVAGTHQRARSARLGEAADEVNLERFVIARINLDHAVQPFSAASLRHAAATSKSSDGFRHN